MGSLTVHVLDEDQEPVTGGRVRLIFPSRYTHSEEYTDDNGVAEFDEVPWGTTIEVHVNGESQVDTSLDGSDDHEDVTVTI